MTPERFQQIRDLFEAALELDASERASFLVEACQDDSELHEEVYQLLAAREVTRTLGHGQDGSETQPRRSLAAGEPPHVNDRIDRYRLLRVLGDGGMGIVAYPTTSASGWMRD